MLVTAYTKDSELFSKSWTCWNSKTDNECGVCLHCKTKADKEKTVRRQVKNGL